ncbi:hypothetical protein BDQ17DRAFT_1422037 [Cyathus striatus]|nr:hypothetical protein BDQ17DRAFT_1440065 [Cyathus striatus]KAF9008836.1 hypothetical protein BDQ17DRAFT_1422037 [Cyathus striatus]
MYAPGTPTPANTPPRPNTTEQDHIFCLHLAPSETPKSSPDLTSQHLPHPTPFPYFNLARPCFFVALAFLSPSLLVLFHSVLALICAPSALLSFLALPLPSSGTRWPGSSHAYTSLAYYRFIAAGPAETECEM